MKKSFFSLIVGLVCSANAYAAFNAGSGTTIDPMIWEHMACDAMGTYSIMYCNATGKYIKYADCKICPDNTEFTTSQICANPTITIQTCTSTGGGGGSILPGNPTILNCNLAVDSECDSCTPTTDWTPSGTTSILTRYEERTISTCTPDTDCKCKYTTERRCAANSYGTPSCSTKQSTGIQCSGCSGCPSQDGIAGSSNAGSTAITNCYIKAGSTGTTSNNDKYSISQQCNYSN